MTQEEIIAALRKIQENTDDNSIDTENREQEVASINQSIDGYNAEIADLEEKISNMDNYKYEDTRKEERDLTIELLEEAFTSQLETIERETREYNNLQNIATTIFSDYNLEIESLNNDIEMIERRIRKNDIAISKNIGIRLTEEELADLNNQLAEKRVRIAECNDMKEKYVTGLKDFGDLITANNRRKETIEKKQSHLNQIIEDRKNNHEEIDKFKLRTDKDKLASLKAGLNALISRKESIMYNPKTEINNIIESLKNPSVDQTRVEEPVVSNQYIHVQPDVTESYVEPSVEPEVSHEAELVDPTPVNSEPTLDDRREDLINAYNARFDDIPPIENYENKATAPTLESQFNNGEIFTDPIQPEEKKEEGLIVAPPVGMTTVDNDQDPLIDDLQTPEDPREAEIEDGNPELVHEKRKGLLNEKWKKWVARLTAAAAVVAVILAAKGCQPKETKLENDEPVMSSSTQETTIEEDTLVKNNGVEATYSPKTNTVTVKNPISKQEPIVEKNTDSKIENTTTQPTTEAPTTEAPTTEAPTTEAPTTEALTTEVPTTEKVTEKETTTQAPTTEKIETHDVALDSGETYSFNLPDGNVLTINYGQADLPTGFSARYDMNTGTMHVSVPNNLDYNNLQEFYNNHMESLRTR